MAERESGGPIPDSAVVAVLRPFVRATRPVLAGLRETDPFGLRARVAAEAGPDDDRGLRDRVLDFLATVEVPGTAAWASMPPAQRSRWWVRRVGRFTTLAAAVPGIGGALANRLPISSALGAAGQGLVLVAIAGEHGVTDEDEVIGMLGAVLLRRELVVERPDAEADAAADARAAELTGDLAGPEDRPTLQRVGSAVWRLGRALFAVEDELDKHPHGNWFHSALGNLPVVGAVGKYLGEWSGLKRAAREAELRLKVA
ncbi:hypothetical protein [Pseudonocardia hydrocarbonoxydans]|uniref:Uncharacterized protein n=1 Tax=Pseudonocardia hydrocarbonoxydans TaxID=76726 RepID=A0A4Y3WPM4_9PSEU|nr:hypothetical protein [Pseudonocardia hydrocarbonoxydans]GEC20724.1 hypothetical protein PHY01_30070 [Pseudonocardia hydrocarbonoxydans]